MQIVELTLLKEFAGDDNEVLSELIKVFLKQTPEILENMQKAENQNDWFTVSRQAHKLKPSLGTMGMEKEKNLALEIESNCEAGEIELIKNKIEVLTKRCKEAMVELQQYAS